jgi:hypothetical protein
VVVPKIIRRLWLRVRLRLAGERGSVMVIVVCSLPLMIGFIVMTVDLGTLRVDRQRAQMAADAAALAGAGDTSNGIVVPATAQTDADSYVKSNDPNATDTVTPDYNGDDSSVRVDVTQQVPLAFAGLFGISSKPVSASAVASDELATPLGYFGNDNSDLQDGSSTPDGWDNFCATDGSSNSSGQTSPQIDSDPMRCTSASPKEDSQLDGWTVVHGGIDVAAEAGAFSSPTTDDGTTDDQMVDLTGTCVEAVGTYPSAAGSAKGSYTSITVNGQTTKDDGYCENNDDGEIEQGVPTQPGQQYTVSFYLGMNTWGYPSEKALMAVVSNTDLASLPAIADTRGADDSSGKFGTTYPLENSGSTWNSLIYRGEYFEWGPTGSEQTPPWTKETFTFTATSSPTYVGFGSLDNCAPDWTSSSSLNNGDFYTTGSTDSATTSIAPITSSVSWQQPPPEVHDYDNSPWQDQCFYGPGISDVRVTGPGNIVLTQ